MRQQLRAAALEGKQVEGEGFEDRLLAALGIPFEGGSGDSHTRSSGEQTWSRRKAT